MSDLGVKLSTSAVGVAQVAVMLAVCIAAMPASAGAVTLLGGSGRRMVDTWPFDRLRAVAARASPGRRRSRPWWRG